MANLTKRDVIIIIVVPVTVVLCVIMMSMVGPSTPHDQNQISNTHLKKDLKVTSRYETESMNIDNNNYLLCRETPAPGVLLQIQEIKKNIQQLNGQQRLLNNRRFGGIHFNNVVLVVCVHPYQSYLYLILDSIRQIQGIHKSLLIFAHYQYDEQIYKVITKMKLARVLQIFYPYSIQLHPNAYPGDDGKFCQKLDQCTISLERNPVLAQEKLFRWWVTNQVFDYIQVLKNYRGYIYFFDGDQYLTKDLITMATLLERLQPVLCPSCRILSLGSSTPRLNLYRPRSVSLIISAWGWSNYSNSGFGLNRTTWDEIKRLKQKFCYFRDPSWVNSLKHLASKTQERQLYMLYMEAPRFFPLSGCGAFNNGSGCTVDTVYQDIVKFIAKIRYWEGRETFSVKLDSSSMNMYVEPRGLWGDARDMNLCMFFSSEGGQQYS